jgi:RNA polymerase sigma factor (sigma-70 family)
MSTVSESAKWPKDCARIDESQAKAMHEVRIAICRSLARRGASWADADDAAQRAFERIWTSATHLEKLDDLQKHLGYFVKMGYTCWLGELRSEKARRSREERYSDQPQGDVGPMRRSLRLADLFEPAGLTATQVEYLKLLTEHEMSVVEIARIKGLSERSVNRVVQRAQVKLREAVNKHP